jgi:aryl-alcohol dehydrogenase-like predicted oxidoreductase
MPRSGDISTRGGEFAKRTGLDRVVILAAQLQILESMPKLDDAEYCTHRRDKNVAVRQLEESLTRLQTDHPDIWHTHMVIYEIDRDLILAPNGVAEALLKAKWRGLLAGSNRTLVQPE